MLNLPEATCHLPETIQFLLILKVSAHPLGDGSEGTSSLLSSLWIYGTFSCLTCLEPSMFALSWTFHVCLALRFSCLTCPEWVKAHCLALSEDKTVALPLVRTSPSFPSIHLKSSLVRARPTLYNYNLKQIWMSSFPQFESNWPGFDPK